MSPYQKQSSVDGGARPSKKGSARRGLAARLRLLGCSCFFVACMTPDFAPVDGDVADVPDAEDDQLSGDLNTCDAQVDNYWFEHLATLEPTAPLGEDWFGRGIRFLDSSTLAMNSDAEGAVYLATRDGDQWSIVDRVTTGVEGDANIGWNIWGDSEQFFLSQLITGESKVREYVRVAEDEWEERSEIGPADYDGFFGQDGAIAGDLLVSTTTDTGLLHTFRRVGEAWVEVSTEDLGLGRIAAARYSDGLLHLYVESLTGGESPGVRTFELDGDRWLPIVDSPDRSDRVLGSSRIHMVADEDWVGWLSHDGSLAEFVRIRGALSIQEPTVPVPSGVDREPRLAREGDLVAIGNWRAFQDGLPDAGVVEFHRLAPDGIEFVAALTSPEPRQGEGFGIEVDMHLPYVAVTRFFGTVGNFRPGVVDVFRLGACPDGSHGTECEFRCDDGELNGQEESVDLGGPCVCTP